MCTNANNIVCAWLAASSFTKMEKLYIMSLL